MEQEVNSKKDVLLDYTFVLDASGSMHREIPEVLEELNRQIRELKLKFKETLRPCRTQYGFGPFHSFCNLKFLNRCPYF